MQYAYFNMHQINVKNRLFIKEEIQKANYMKAYWTSLIMEGRITDPPQRYSCPNLQICEYLTLHSKKGLCRYDWIRDLKMARIGEPKVIVRVLRRGKQACQGWERLGDEGSSRWKRCDTMLALKTGEGAMSQKAQVASGSWQKLWDQLTPQLPVGSGPADTLTLA